MVKPLLINREGRTGVEVLSGMTLVGRTSPPPPLLGVLFIVLGCSGTRRPTFVAAADVTRIVRCLGVRTAFHHECSAIGACSLSTPARRLAGPPTNPLPPPPVVHNMRHRLGEEQKSCTVQRGTWGQRKSCLSSRGMAVWLPECLAEEEVAKTWTESRLFHYFL